MEDDQLLGFTQMQALESDSYSSADDEEEFPEFSCSLAKLKQYEAEIARHPKERNEDEKPDLQDKSKNKTTTVI